MNRSLFQNKYRDLASVIGAEFADSSARDDAETARRLAHEFPPEERARHFEEMLNEAHRLMGEIDEYWEAMAKEANRRLYTRDAAREWLMRVMIAWQEELTRLKSSR